MEYAVAATELFTDVGHSGPTPSGSGVDYGLLPELTGFSVKLTLVLAQGLIARELKSSGITPLRFSMLEVVGGNPGLQQKQLAEALALTRPATTLVLDFWEARGCIERRTLPGDRRSFGIHLTEIGVVELARVRTIIKQADAELTSYLTQAEAEEFRRLLKKIRR